jgi:hypothetical protein
VAIEGEIELFAAELRAAAAAFDAVARRVEAAPAFAAAVDLETPKPAPKLNCQHCHGKGVITGKTGTEFDCRKCSGTGIAPVKTKSKAKSNGKSIPA